MNALAMGPPALATAPSVSTTGARPIVPPAPTLNALLALPMAEEYPLDRTKDWGGLKVFDVSLLSCNWDYRRHESTLPIGPHHLSLKRRAADFQGHSGRRQLCTLG